MTIDLTPVIQAAVGLAGIVLLTFGSWALQRLAKRLNVDISQGQQQLLEQALQKSIQAGGVMAEHLAAAKGWDHPEVKNAVLAEALSAIVSRFPDAIKGVGLDMNQPADVDRVRDALKRILPTAIMPIVASSATASGPASPSPPVDTSVAVTTPMGSPAT